MNNIILIINLFIAIYLIVSTKSIKSLKKVLWIIVQIVLAYIIMTKSNYILSISIIEIIYIMECIYLKIKWE